MNRHQKAILRAAALNLQGRAKNCREYVKVGNGPAENIKEREGAAYAFQVSVDYLVSLALGHEKPSKLCQCQTPELFKDGEEIPWELTVAHCKTCKGVI
jgi:hypothetical protein